MGAAQLTSHRHYYQSFSRVYYVSVTHIHIPLAIHRESESQRQSERQTHRRGRLPAQGPVVTAKYIYLLHPSYLLRTYVCMYTYSHTHSSMHMYNGYIYKYMYEPVSE